MMAIKPNDNFITLQVNFKNTFALVDTGAVASCMSVQFAKILRLRPVPVVEDLKLVSANKTPMTSLGTVDVNLSIQGLVVPHTFYVLKSLAHNIVLGQDFLNMSGAVIDCRDRCITLYDGLVTASLTRVTDQNSMLRLAQSIIIPAAAEVIAKVFVPRLFQRKTSLMETFAPLKNRFLVTAGALVHPTGRSTICRILNTGLTSQKLRAGTTVAQLSAIDLADPFNAAMLSVDISDKRPTDIGHSNKTVPSHEERIKILETKGLKLDGSPLDVGQFAQLTELLWEYQEIFCADYEQLPTSKLAPYHINLTNDQPIRQRQYPLTPQNERIMEKYVDKLLKAKIVETSHSPWNAPAILIRKANFDPQKADDPSQFRLCVDFRKVNQVIAPEVQLLSSAPQIINQVAETRPRFFSSFDLACGFYQIPLDEQSKQVTAFSTRSRHVHFCRVAMGVKSSPWAFLASMYDLFRAELGTNHLSIYMDEAIICHENFQQHLEFLRHIFNKLRQANLRLNPKKSFFARNSLSFPGIFSQFKVQKLIPHDTKRSKTYNQQRMLNKLRCC